MSVSERLPVAPIMEGPTNQTILRGDNATFECNILTSDSQPLLQWLKHKEINGSYVNEKGEPYVDVLQVWVQWIAPFKILVSHCVINPIIPVRADQRLRSAF